MKLCAICETPFKPDNAKGIYCSNKCKQVAYRSRKEPVATRQPPPAGWQHLIAEYCANQGITPEVLITVHQSFSARLAGHKKAIAKTSPIEETIDDPTTMSRTERLRRLTEQRSKNGYR